MLVLVHEERADDGTVKEQGKICSRERMISQVMARMRESFRETLGLHKMLKSAFVY